LLAIRLAKLPKDGNCQQYGITKNWQRGFPAKGQKGNTARRHCGCPAILHSGVRLVLLRAGNQAMQIAARS